MAGYRMAESVLAPGTESDAARAGCGNGGVFPADGLSGPPAAEPTDEPEPSNMATGDVPPPPWSREKRWAFVINDWFGKLGLSADPPAELLGVVRPEHQVTFRDCWRRAWVHHVCGRIIMALESRLRTDGTWQRYELADAECEELCPPRNWWQALERELRDVLEQAHRGWPVPHRDSLLAEPNDWRARHASYLREVLRVDAAGLVPRKDELCEL